DNSLLSFNPNFIRLYRSSIQYLTADDCFMYRALRRADTKLAPSVYPGHNGLHWASIGQPPYHLDEVLFPFLDPVHRGSFTFTKWFPARFTPIPFVTLTMYNHVANPHFSHVFAILVRAEFDGRLHLAFT